MIIKVSENINYKICALLTHYYNNKSKKIKKFILYLNTKKFIKMDNNACDSLNNKIFTNPPYY